MGRVFSLVFLCLPLTWGSVLQAQTGQAMPALGLAVGLSLGRAWVRSRGYTTVSLEASSIRPSQVQPDFGLSILTQPGEDRLALADVGINHSSRGGPAILLVRAGAATVFQLHRPGGAAVGLQAGFSILPAKGWGPRLDVTRRYYLGEGGQLVPVWSVGLGISWGRDAGPGKPGGWKPRETQR